jgi:hypothetical protein
MQVMLTARPAGLTPEGERLRAAFWRALTEDAGPLEPLGDADLRALARILGVIGDDAPDRVEAAQAPPG